jgi:hypothetical protein
MRMTERNKENEKNDPPHYFAGKPPPPSGFFSATHTDNTEPYFKISIILRFQSYRKKRMMRET